MFLAQVLGTVVSPVQIPILDDEKLLLLRPVKPDGTPTGKTRIGIDRAQAGEGDRVLVLDGGRVVQQGHHRELVQQSGTYRRLWEREQAATQLEAA